jgi:hypothetical protein
LDNTNGWWSSIAIEDFNQDGFPDVVVGNLGLNNRLKPTNEFPIKMVVADFDKNGSTMVPARLIKVIIARIQISLVNPLKLSIYV